MKYIVEHISAEYFRSSREFKAFDRLEEDEQEQFIKELILYVDRCNVCPTDEYDSLEVALKKASDPYYTVRQGNAGSYLYVEFDEISAEDEESEKIEFLGVKGIDSVEDMNHNFNYYFNKEV